MSASHCKIEESGGKFTLTDLNSRNGTYVRLKAERELAHGDYLFIGASSCASRSPRRERVARERARIHLFFPGSDDGRSDPAAASSA